MKVNSLSRRLTTLSTVLLIVALAGLTPAVRAPPAPISADFSMNCNPMSLTLLVGTSGSSTCTLTSLNGFAGSLTIIGTAQPSGILTVQPDVNRQSAVTLSAGGTATIIANVTTTASTPPFVYSDLLVASSSTSFHTFVLETVVNPIGGPNFPDYTVGLSASSITIARGNSGSSIITMTSLNGFAGPLTLDAKLTPAQFANPVISFATGVQVSNETLVKVSTAPFTATLNVSTVLTTPTGIYAVVIQMLSLIHI